MYINNFKKTIGKLLALMVPIKSKRKAIRNYFNNMKNKDKITDEEFEKLYSKLKFGVSYSVWDGEELLESSIKQIRKYVDYINVVWQEKSWSGLPCNPTLKSDLDEMKAKGLIDELIEYKSLCDGSYQEPNKRQLGLDAAIKAGCNYFMVMDVDEFYVGEEFENAKRYMIKNGITKGITLHKPYGKSPTKLYIKCEMAHCQPLFFSKIDKNSYIQTDAEYPFVCDVSRKISTRPNDKFFIIPFIAMHHMCIIRKDLNKKLKGSSAVHIFEKEGLTAENITEKNGMDEKYMADVEDIFGLNEVIKKW